MRQFVTYSGRHKAVLLVLLCLGIGTCDKQITVDTPLVAPRINTSSLPDAIVGESYSQTLSATGGDGNYTWSLGSDTLPAGLSLSSTSGRISGEPTTVGNSTFTVEVTSVGLKDTRQLDIEVEYGPPVITTTELRTGTIGQSYADTLKATGGDNTYTWTHTGQLPDGMELTASGVLTGRIRITGNWPLGIQVTSVGRTSEKSLTLYGTYPEVEILTTDLPAAEVGVSYTRSLTAKGGNGEYSWSISSGSLPAGLSFSDTTGVISGTPTVTDTSTFVVRVSSEDKSADAVFDMSVVAGPLSITTSSLPDGELGKNYVVSVGAEGGDGRNYSWSLFENLGNLPTGLGLSSDGDITGIPTITTTSSFTLVVVSGARTANKTLSVTIVDSLSISTDSFPDGAVGEPYSQILSAAGGTGTYTWSKEAGELPGGLSLSSTGAISGTPTIGGTNSFLIKLTSGDLSTTKALSISVNSPLSISTGLLQDAVAGSEYSFALQATGGDGSYSWLILNGRLPAGLSISSQGLIIGTPTGTGASTFTAQVTSGGQTASKTLSLIVTEGLTITTNSLPGASVGVPYSQSLTAQAGDGTYTWSRSDGALPAGLTLSTQGLISGTPTASGLSSFTVQVSSAGQTTTKALSITVNEGLSITSTVMDQGAVSASYSDTLNAVGGDGTYTWSLPSGTGSLPSGLNMSAAGVISGTPTTAGTTSFTVQVASAGETASGTVSIEVLSALTISGSATLSAGIVGHAYSDTLAATGGQSSYSWSLQGGSLPSGLNLSTGGVISGTPTTAQSRTFTVRVSSGAQFADKSLSITIGATVSITTTALATGMVTIPYNQSLNAAGGDGSYSWALISGSLPTGLTISAAGVISGTPTAADTTNFSVNVVSAGDTATTTLSINIVVEDKGSLPFGSTLTDLSEASYKGVRTWTTEVPAGTAALVVQTESGVSPTGAYLYVAQGTGIGTSAGQYDCQAFHGEYYSPPSARCVFENPAPGTWSIMLQGWGVYNGISLSVNPEPESLPFGTTITDLAASTYDYANWTTEVPAGTSSLVIQLEGAQLGEAGEGILGAHHNLYVAQGPVVGTGLHYDGTSGEYDCKDYAAGRCVFQNPEPGTWSIMISSGSSYSYGGVSLSVNPEPKTLSLESVVTDLSGERYTFDDWTLEVPTGTSSLVIEMEGGSSTSLLTWPRGPQLVVQRGSSVTRLTNSAADYSSSYSLPTPTAQSYCGAGLPARCVFDNPAPGTWSVLLSTPWVDGGTQGVSSYSDVSLTVNPESLTLPFGTTLTGLAGAKGFDTWTTEVPANSGSLVIEMTEGSTTGAPPNLYVAQGASVGTTSSQYDCLEGWPARCVFENPTAGTWSIMIGTDGVSSYSGVSLAGGASVAQVATTIEISPTSLAFVSSADTATLSATVKDQSGTVMTDATVTWSSSNTAVATVSSAGLVIAVGVGTATITAASGPASATASVTMTDDQAPTVTWSTTSYSYNDELYGSVDVNINATDNYSIDSISFFIDGTRYGYTGCGNVPKNTSAPITGSTESCADTSAAFVFAWNSIASPAGVRALKTTVYDENGNSTTLTGNVTLMHQPHLKYVNLLYQKVVVSTKTSASDLLSADTVAALDSIARYFAIPSTDSTRASWANVRTLRPVDGVAHGEAIGGYWQGQNPSSNIRFEIDNVVGDVTWYYSLWRNSSGVVTTPHIDIGLGSEVNECWSPSQSRYVCQIPSDSVLYSTGFYTHTDSSTASFRELINTTTVSANGWQWSSSELLSGMSTGSGAVILHCKRGPSSCGEWISAGSGEAAEGATGQNIKTDQEVLQPSSARTHTVMIAGEEHTFLVNTDDLRVADPHLDEISSPRDVLDSSLQPRLDSIRITVPIDAEEILARLNSR